MTSLNGLAAAMTLAPGSCSGAGQLLEKGPAAAALSPKPRNLTENPYVPGLTDQYLFDLIQKGGAAVGKSPLMPPWGQALKDQDIRDVIGFVRTLSK